MQFIATPRFTIYEDAPLGYLYEIVSFAGFRHRGPKIDFSQPYICCVGNSFTFGRFVERPYPEILSDLLGAQVLNLGFGKLAPEDLADPFLLNIINGSKLAVLQFRAISKVTGLKVPTLRPLFGPHKPIMGHYPSQASHELAATVLADRIRELRILPTIPLDIFAFEYRRQMAPVPLETDSISADTSQH